MMKQTTTLKLETINQLKKLEYQKGMTIKGKRNSRLKIIANKRRHHFWANTFERKRIMSDYFSESAFGSQSDSKIEFYDPWKDIRLLQKHRIWLIEDAGASYDADADERFTIENIAFMNQPTSNNEDNRE